MKTLEENDDENCCTYSNWTNNYHRKYVQYLPLCVMILRGSYLLRDSYMILRGPLLMLMVAQSSVGAESLLRRSNDHIMKRGENQERISYRFSSSSDSFFDKFNLQKDQWRMDYSLPAKNWSTETDMKNTTRAPSQGESIKTTQLAPSTIVGNMEKILEETHLPLIQGESIETSQLSPSTIVGSMEKILEETHLSLNQGESIETSQLSPSTIVGSIEKILEATHLESAATGRSFTVLHMFLKSLKNTLKSLRPEIKFSECAQKYFFSTSDSSSKQPTHDHDKKKKKKRKHKHDPGKDYSDHITDGVVSSVFSLHSDLADFIYEEYRPYLHVVRSVYRNVKSTIEIVRQDPLMKCTVDYLVARFCIWVDG